MQATDHGLGLDPAKPLDGAANGHVLAQRQVRSGSIVVFGVAGHDPAKVALPEHDKMVGALPPCRAYLPFHIGVLPGRAWRDGSIPDTHPAQTPFHDLAIEGVSIS